MTVLSYPIPSYQNLPIRADYYEPRRFVISNITLGQTTIVTTTEDQNYVIGQLIRLLIPGTYGSYQLNNREGYVIEILSTTQVRVDIDSSRNVNSFVAGTDRINMPQILPIGDVNMGPINTQGRVNNITFIPGSFINVSP